MRIAILGAPGAGKTKLARRLAKEFDLTLVDGYTQRLQRSTDLALGPWATYRENYMVAGARLAAEAKVKDNYVVVGTVIDTITYAIVKTDLARQQTAEGFREMYQHAQQAMGGLSAIYREWYPYCPAFWLPSDSQESWVAALNAAYPPVLEAYNPDFTYLLPEGTLNDRTDIAIEATRIAKEEAERPLRPAEGEPPTATEESPVREGGTPSSEPGQEPG